ncbi:MAG: serine/threonine protein kinase [Chloroflexi bacterium]|nr:serine/threonine protein kinase [Chloroflexota bacterium]
MMLQIGDQFDHFIIQSHLAQGGMSDIYGAYNLLTGQQVAVKIPSPSLVGDPGQYERFQRELQIINTLNHPAIQRGLGSGHFDRTPYLVTTWIQGRSLREIIDEQAPMEAGQAIELAKKIGEGLAYCHTQGIIHRDIKPENILVTPQGQPVILDFGLAMSKGSRRVTYANLTAVAGTPEYMAPEQIEGQRGDQRTDIYALGAVLYEMLSGSPPYQGDSSYAVMNQHLHGALPRLDQVQPSVTPQLAAVVTRALQRQPGERYPDMAAMLAALENPDTADLALLERAGRREAGRRRPMPDWLRIVVICGLVMAALVALGVLAQFLRG